MIDSSLVVCFLLGVVLVALGPILGGRSTRARSALAVAAAAFHPLLTVGLFFSLALHMHRRLGAWPEQLGHRGFPEALVWHADLAQVAFGSLVLGGLVVLPLALLLCSFVPGLRSCLRYLGIYGCVSIAAVGAMQLAPAPFLSWWWD